MLAGLRDSNLRDSSTSARTNNCNALTVAAAGYDAPAAAPTASKARMKGTGGSKTDK